MHCLPIVRIVGMAALGVVCVAGARAWAEPEAVPPVPDEVSAPAEETSSEPAETDAQGQASAEENALQEAVDTQAPRPAAPAATTEGAVDTGESLVVGSVGRARQDWLASFTFDAETLAQLSYDDVHRILARVPGVQIREEDGFGLRPNIGIRGVSSDRSAKITIMEDGVLLGPAPYSAPAAYYFPLINRMTGIEVTKGVRLLAHGPFTVGGSLNLRSAAIPAEGEHVYLQGGMGNFGFQRLHGRVAGSEGQWGWLVEGTQMGSTGFKTYIGDVPGLDGADTGFLKRETMGKIRWRSQGARPHELQLKIGLGDEVSRETYLGLTEAEFEADPYGRYPISSLGRMRWERTQAVLSYRVQAGERSEFRADIYRHDFFRSWRKANHFGDESNVTTFFNVVNDPGGSNDLYLDVARGNTTSTGTPIDSRVSIGPNRRQFFSQGIQLGGAWFNSDETLALDAGLRLHQDQIKRKHLQRPFAVSDGILLPDGPEVLQTLNREMSTALAGFTSATATIGHWVARPAIRVESIWTEYDADLNINAPSVTASQLAVLPGLGLERDLAEDTVVRAGVHRGFSPKAPRAGAAGDPELSWAYELGLRYEATRKLEAGRPAQASPFGLSADHLREEDRLPMHRGFTLDVGGFYTDYQNLLAQCAQRTGCDDQSLGAQFTGGEVEIMGLEVDVQDTRPLGRGDDALQLESAFTYTLLDSSFGSRFLSPFPLYGQVEVGDELPYLPRHQGMLSLGLVERSEKWSLRPSLRFVSEQRDVAGQGEIRASERVAPYTVLDAVADIRVGRGQRASLHVDNILDEAYVAARRPYGLRPGKPRTLWVGYSVELESL